MVKYISDDLELLSLLQHPSTAICTSRVWEGGLEGGAETAVPNGRHKGIDKRFMTVHTLRSTRDQFLEFAGSTMSGESLLTCSLRITQRNLCDEYTFQKRLRLSIQGPTGPAGFSKLVNPNGVITKLDEDNPLILMYAPSQVKPHIELFSSKTSKVDIRLPFLASFKFDPRVQVMVPRYQGGMYFLNVRNTNPISAGDADKQDLSVA